MPLLKLSFLVSLLVAAGCGTTDSKALADEPWDPAAAETAFVLPPDRFGEVESIAPPAEEPAGEYVCPMHPEVKSSKPGDCPKCGMHLEPVKKEDGK